MTAALDPLPLRCSGAFFVSFSPSVFAKEFIWLLGKVGPFLIPTPVAIPLHPSPSDADSPLFFLCALLCAFRRKVTRFPLLGEVSFLRSLPSYSSFFGYWVALIPPFFIRDGLPLSILTLLFFLLGCGCRG